MTTLSAKPVKTVYVLGAGFSRHAKLPLQNEILDQLKGRPIAEPILRQIMKDFRSQGVSPTLGDLFTLLDQAVSQRQFAVGFPWQDLAKARRALMDEVLAIIHDAAQRVKRDALGFYRSLAAELMARRVAGGWESDPFSIVSLNWDCLLEDSAYWCIRKASALGRVDVDYCCYTTPLSAACPHTPSILQRAKGIFNLRVIKLHGSANWLLCPSCGKLFTGLGAEDVDWDQYVWPQFCPFCQPLGSGQQEPSGGPQLEPAFVTPTFLKVFEDPHIRMIWHNAYMELVEATRVVFVGYSLPEADYHLRALLRRAVRPSAQVVAVLVKTDSPDANTPIHLRSLLASDRYRTFFGASRVTIDLRGARRFFKAELNLRPWPEHVRRLRSALRASSDLAGNPKPRL